MLANFLGLNLKVSYISKKNFGLRSRTPFFTYFHSLRQFHVTIQKRRLRNKQESVMHVQSCFFAKINLLLFCRSRCCRRRRCLSSLFKRKLTVTTLTADLLATSANNTSLTFMAFARRLLRSFLVFNFFFLGS